MKKSTEKPPFFGLQDRMPVVLGIILGFQHALAMLVRWRLSIDIEDLN
jgi:xanthine/uracil permease